MSDIIYIPFPRSSPDQPISETNYDQIVAILPPFVGAFDNDNEVFEEIGHRFEMTSNHVSEDDQTTTRIYNYVLFEPLEDSKGFRPKSASGGVLLAQNMGFRREHDDGCYSASCWGYDEVAKDRNSGRPSESRRGKSKRDKEGVWMCNNTETTHEWVASRWKEEGKDVDVRVFGADPALKLYETGEMWDMSTEKKPESGAVVGLGRQVSYSADMPMTHDGRCRARRAGASSRVERNSRSQGEDTLRDPVRSTEPLVQRVHVGEAYFRGLRDMRGRENFTMSTSSVCRFHPSTEWHLLRRGWPLAFQAADAEEYGHVSPLMLLTNQLEGGLIDSFDSKQRNEGKGDMKLQDVLREWGESEESKLAGLFPGMNEAIRHEFYLIDMDKRANQEESRVRSQEAKVATTPSSSTTTGAVKRSSWRSHRAPESLTSKITGRSGKSISGKSIKSVLLALTQRSIARSNESARLARFSPAPSPSQPSSVASTKPTTMCCDSNTSSTHPTSVDGVKRVVTGLSVGTRNTEITPQDYPSNREHNPSDSGHDTEIHDEMHPGFGPRARQF